VIKTRFIRADDDASKIQSFYDSEFVRDALGLWYCEDALSDVDSDDEDALYVELPLNTNSPGELEKIVSQLRQQPSDSPSLLTKPDELYYPERKLYGPLPGLVHSAPSGLTSTTSALKAAQDAKKQKAEETASQALLGTYSPPEDPTFEQLLSRNAIAGGAALITGSNEPEWDKTPTEPNLFAKWNEVESYMSPAGETLTTEQYKILLELWQTAKLEFTAGAAGATGGIAVEGFFAIFRNWLHKTHWLSLYRGKPEGYVCERG
jgi:hypothetical protein